MINELETALAAAVDALPSRRSTARTIGSQLGINAGEMGLHTRHPRRRSFIDGQGQVAATALITRLPASGETIHLLMDGNFTLANVIPVIQEQIKEPCRLTICTLGLNDATADTLATMLQDGRLTELRLAMSSYFKASDPEAAAHAIATLKPMGTLVAVERLHAKLQLWQPVKGRSRYVLETSSNLRSCNCVEIATLTNDARLHRWHDQWLTKFFDRTAL